MRALTKLSATQFENLIFDLVQAIGLKNCVWRTPGRDTGRDIQGDWFVEDLSGVTRRESWYVECKRYRGSVGWPIVWEKIAYAQSNSADTLLFVTTSSLSPQAIDEVNKWNASRKSPQVRFWGGHDLIPRLEMQPALQLKYGLSANPSAAAAIALLPLTRILVSYANASEAAIAFGTNASPANVVIHALAELISVKLQDFEHSGRLLSVEFRAEEDAYEWMANGDLLESRKFDRYTVRAIFAMVWFAAKAPINLRVQGSRVVIAVVRHLPDTLIRDLEAVALWGSLQINYIGHDEEISIEHH